MVVFSCQQIITGQSGSHIKSRRGRVMKTNKEDKSKAFRQVIKKSDYNKWQAKMVSLLFYLVTKQFFLEIFLVLEQYVSITFNDISHFQGMQLDTPVVSNEKIRVLRHMQKSLPGKHVQGILQFFVILTVRVAHRTIEPCCTRRSKHCRALLR